MTSPFVSGPKVLGPKALTQGLPGRKSQKKGEKKSCVAKSWSLQIPIHPREPSKYRDFMPAVPGPPVLPETVMEDHRKKARRLDMRTSEERRKKKNTSHHT